MISAMMKRDPKSRKKGPRSNPVFRFLFPLLLLFPFLATNAHAQKETWGERIYKANHAFREGRFEEAVEEYNRLIDDGCRNGHIQFNLGNAYFKQGNLGQAILHYERARLHIPRDADLRFNLQYTLDQTVDAIADSPGMIKQGLFWLEDFTAKELGLVFVGFNVLFWSILALRLFYRQEWTYYGLIILLILWAISGLSFTVKWVDLATDDRAIVIAEEVDVLAGPDIKDTLLFKLHEGSRARFERAEEGWSLIALPDDKRGWVSTESIALIRE